MERGSGVYAARAGRAYAAMQNGWRRGDGLYRRDGRLRMRGAAAHLWPFARAIVATLDLAGIEHGLVEGFDAEAAIADRLQALERYHDPGGDGPPAYSSDVLGTRFGGDRYYDDNAWVGLALVELERLRPGAGDLARAEELFGFAAGGWDRRLDAPSPGGVFWVEQGRGVGARNHDRNTVSNAPNAELGLHLAELRGVTVDGVEEMYEWVLATLDASRDGDSPGSGLFWDKLRGDHTLDDTLWSYNQGSMLGANVLLARRGEGGPGAGRAGAAGGPRYLARAEAIARKALRHFGGGGFDRQPAAFNAIFFRNLLLLHAATDDDSLRTEIIAAMRGYADRAWDERRGDDDRFHFSGHAPTLLDQSAMVQLLALLAWDPAWYRLLA